LKDPNLATTLLNFDKENVSAKQLAKIRQFTRRDHYMPHHVVKKSAFVKVMMLWVMSIDQLHNAKGM